MTDYDYGPPVDDLAERRAAPPCATILALDLSSTALGWVILDGTIVRASGEVTLRGDGIASRCRAAFHSVELLVEVNRDIDCVAIESPVWRFAKATIPQCHVQGAVLARAALFGLHVIEVTPSQAKRRLSGQGNGTKEEMQRAAACYGVAGEHASDALGVGLWAAERVQVMG
jgi:Holliday junction resolvasome RuvABC endonuclease subunit